MNIIDKIAKECAAESLEVMNSDQRAAWAAGSPGEWEVLEGDWEYLTESLGREPSEEEGRDFREAYEAALIESA